MKFIDRAKIFVRSGKGGDGKVSFLHLPNKPKGGPDGGDGGKGGSIVFYVDPNKDTLIDFTRKVHFYAEHGENGRAENCHGKSAEDLVIHIPLGTQIFSENLEVMYFDAVEAGQYFTLFEGGKGGVGNTRFVSSTNRAPRERTEGEPYQEAWIRLVLKIFCDYGFVGLPNAGKSSLLKILTGSSTKVGDYPFTTLNPKLGTIWDQDTKLVLADLPGIIKGASENKGLGHDFLGHVERCKGILHIIDISLMQSLELLELMLFELNAFSSELLKKKQIVVLNKIDLVDSEIIQQEINFIKEKYDFCVVPVCAQNKVGIDDLLQVLLVE